MRQIRTSQLTDVRANGLSFWSAALLFTLLLGSTACARRPLPPLPPASPPSAPEPAPQPGAEALLPPELSVLVEPSVIRKGESALLSWEARNADQVFVNHNIGAVGVSGKIKFFPEETTTYTVTAQGPGGRVEKSVTVDIADDKEPGLTREDLPGKSMEERFNYFVKPVFFDFDSAELTEEAKITLDGNIRWLASPENAYIRFLIEGHCDERGTEEYNLALGDKRAQVVKRYLLDAGIHPSRMVTVTLGEERPFDSRQTEEAWALNRRAHFLLLQE